MKYVVSIGDREFAVEISESSGKLTAAVEGRTLDTSVVIEPERHRFLMLLDAQSYDAEVFAANGAVSVFMHGREFDCRVEDQRLADIRRTAGVAARSTSNELRAPMPGLVVRILHAPGDTIRKGQPLLVVEAMKMENELKAPADGTIREIHAAVGKPVEKGALLVTFE